MNSPALALGICKAGKEEDVKGYARLPEEMCLVSIIGLSSKTRKCKCPIHYQPSSGCYPKPSSWEAMGRARSRRSGAQCTFPKLQPTFPWTQPPKTQVTLRLASTVGDGISFDSHILKEGQMNALRSLWIFYPAIYQALPNCILSVEFNIKDMESRWADFLFTPRMRGQLNAWLHRANLPRTLVIGVITIGKWQETLLKGVLKFRPLIWAFSRARSRTYISQFWQAWNTSFHYIIGL